MTDRYDIRLLGGELGKLGYDFFYFAKTDSTMKVIQAYALEGKGVQALALADHQTQGVGRNGRVWIDTAGCSLMFSVLFNIPQSSVAVFADLVALTVCETLRNETGLLIKIKYPNDLVIDDKKVGGILVKNMYDEKLQYLGTNVGIGLNVHYKENELKTFPTDYPATSLDIATDSFVNREKLLLGIAKALRFLETEMEVVSKNEKVLDVFETRWREASGVLERGIVILEDDRIIDKGKVVNTGIGRGVELETAKGRKWFSLFDTNMKVRLTH